MLVLVSTHEQVHTAATPSGDAVDGNGRQDLAVHDRLEGHHVDGDLTPPARVRSDGNVVRQLFLGYDEPVGGHGRELPDSRLDAEPPGKLGCHQAGRAGWQDVVAGAALRYCPAEQACRRGHRQQAGDAHPAGGLTEDRHIARVAAERGDVLLHPFQRRDLVEQPRFGLAPSTNKKPSQPRR